jgi:hypothetical protein
MNDTALGRSTPSAGWVELAKRAANGSEVALLWNRASNRVKVAVSGEFLPIATSGLGRGAAGQSAWKSRC